MAAESRKTDKVHMPQDSYFYERVVPALLIALGLVTAFLILFALGVLFGIVHF